MGVDAFAHRPDTPALFEAYGFFEGYAFFEAFYERILRYLPLATVKIRLHRARRRLQAALHAGCDFSCDERNVLVCEPKS